MDVKILVFPFLLSFGGCSIIIPEELPSLLSVAYSNIPPIKKGTDSRVGFGYAFGNHADFQLLFEFGPQTNTNPIGQPYPTNTKRQASEPAPAKVNKNREKFLQSDAGKYLQNWAQKMKKPQKPQPDNTMYKPRPGEVPNLEDSMVELVKNEKGEYEIHQPSGHLPSNILEELRRLYGEKKEEAQNLSKNEVKRSKEEVKRITDDLSNVDLD
ncbi:hypothetical protein JYU34_021687 [Plutella xylostella]|uniref:Uncharacterized protein n=1 Tax=Plutella xylostella TaxID=51655 RepID=A0ABQ7PSQ0_PLUXY|nr:hypothetical protein JYU34_021687 [Plutella xylostella]